MLHNNVVTFVLVRNAEVVEERISWLAHDHGAEELAAEPGTASRGDAGLYEGNLQVGTLLAQDIGGAQAAGAGTYDNDVGFGIGVEIGKVATGCEVVSVGRTWEVATATYSWRETPGSHGWG